MKTNFYNFTTKENNLKYKLKTLQKKAINIISEGCVKNKNAIFYKGMTIVEDEFLEDEVVLIKFSASNYTEEDVMIVKSDEDVMIVKSKAVGCIDFILSESTYMFHNRLIDVSLIIYIVSTRFFEELTLINNNSCTEKIIVKSIQNDGTIIGELKED